MGFFSPSEADQVKEANSFCGILCSLVQESHASGQRTFLE